MNKFFRSTSVLSLLSVGGAALPILLVVAGCPAVPGAGDALEDSPTGAKLFTRIMQDDPYQDWAQFPDYEGTLPSALPHGPMSRVFINGEVESALTNFDGALPDGSIIVKENVGTSPDVTETALTVMWKVQGFDPENNDWFWANMSLEGQIMAEGRVQSCAACHGGARGNDFVFVHQF
jgi:hypothetical protein